MKNIYKILIDEARRSKLTHKHSALLVKCGKIIAQGHNNTNQITLQELRQYGITTPTAHAECVVILDCLKKRVTGGVMYTVAIKNGVIINSTPCPVCKKFMYLHYIKWEDITHGNYNGGRSRSIS